MALLDSLAKMSERYDEVASLIVDPEIIQDQGRYTSLLKEHGGLRNKVEAYRKYHQIATELEHAKTELGRAEDPEEIELYQEEVDSLEPQLEPAMECLRELFVTEDEDANRDAILEIRAGAGGDEAALFAGSLYEMYTRFAELKGWKIEMLEAAAGTVGGFKELTLSVKGDSVYKYLQYESGGHRVQRVPETESQGRVHTSAATVAVLPEVDDVEVNMADSDLRIDTYRSSGPGGQSVNKTSSAIRITHEPTGTVVSCQDEKSQHKNKAKALRILSAKLYELETRKRNEERSSKRKALIGSGDRSQRIRTYNFPQNRLTDHRIGLSLYSLEKILQGELDPVIEPLMEHDKELRLASLDE